MTQRVLVFEWLVGGGRLLDGSIPNRDCPFERQGRQMLAAVVSDFCKAGLVPIVPLDCRIESSPDLKGLALEKVAIEKTPDLYSQLLPLARHASHILLIAPESGNSLANLCESLAECEDKFISPNIDFVRLTANKTATCDTLRKLQIPTTVGVSLADQREGDDLVRDLKRSGLAPPFIVKPNVGAGGEQLQYFENWEWLSKRDQHHQSRIENYIPGLPVSVSCICGPKQSTILPATIQQFETRSLGLYQNAGYPLPAGAEQNARHMAERVIQHLRPRQGYFGIDMVIDEENTAHVIEINPRLTTSYLKLRELTSTNLAQQMVDFAS